MNRFIPGVLAIAAFGLATSLAIPAAAEEAPAAAIPEAGTGIQSISIQYVPAELSSVSGRAKLLGEIKHAAREVCGPAGLRETGSLTIASRNRKCAEQAVSAAMGQLGSSQVAATGL